MKFMHTADIHFDSPFATLAGNGKFAQERRLEQRKVMKEMVEYIKENNIPYFFIAGDLYEQDYIKKSTVEYVNQLFTEIPNTKIFITPGNHDPYIKNSFYKQFKWSENVHIFTNEIEVVEDENVDIYGYGFNDFYMAKKSNPINIKNKQKINILITHGSLDSGIDENREYNPLTTRELRELGFDYVALGHIHKPDYVGKNIVYPGSPISLGFDELGDRGFIAGSIDEENKELKLKFIKTSAKTFAEYSLDTSEINSEEELIEKINNTQFDDNKFYKIILVGKCSFNIDENKILDLVNIENIIRIRNHTQAKYEIEEIANQVSLKGLFAKRILEKIQNTEDEQEKNRLISAFDVGIDILSK